MKSRILSLVTFLFIPALLLITSCISPKKEDVTNVPLDEKVAYDEIMNVIEKENISYYERNFEEWKSTYVCKPYQERMGYWEGYKSKIQHIRGWDSLEINKKKRRFNRKGENKWDSNTQEITDINMRIYPEVAWVTFKEKSFQADTGELLGEALGTRILELEDGQWKIAYVNYLFYPLKKEK